jgi:hypothetical protein
VFLVEGQLFAQKQHLGTNSARDETANHKPETPAGCNNSRLCRQRIERMIGQLRGFAILFGDEKLSAAGGDSLNQRHSRKYPLCVWTSCGKLTSQNWFTQ